MKWRAVIVLVGALVGFVSTSRADHLPDNLQAQGRPEKRLAGIRLNEQTKVSDVIKLYGRPTTVKAWESDEANVSSSYDYYWVRRGLYLHVLVERLLRRNPRWEYVSLIEVNSQTTRKVARTGKGLKVGDNLRDLQRIYGSRLKIRDIPKFKIHDVMIQWRGEEYSLVAMLDRHNKITRLSLFAPE